MFVRKKRNKSGSVSIQIIDKSSGRYQVIKTVGCAENTQQENDLIQLAYELLPSLTKQSRIELSFSQDDIFLKQLQEGFKKIFVVGPELILGKIFDEVGYGKISNTLFRHLVITRLIYP